MMGGSNSDPQRHVCRPDVVSRVQEKAEFVPVRWACEETEIYSAETAEGSVAEFISLHTRGEKGTDGEKRVYTFDIFLAALT